jgi:poly-gamma-glutamate capsule biosynthesis protein CapA/YwtB (metallophosphatase superfamily)
LRNPEISLLRAAALLVGAIAPICLLIWQFNVSAQKPTVVSYPKEISRVTFAIAGDVIPHEPVVRSAEAAESHASAENGATDHTGWDALFADVSDVFRQADFGFINLETPVAPKHSIGSKPFQFDAPLVLLDSLKANGVKIVSFANNHVMDQNYAGFDESLEHLRDAGLLFVGSGDNAAAAWKPVILDKNGIKIGWIGMTRWLNGRRNPEKDSDPHVAFFPYPGESGGAPGMDEAGVLDAVRAARAQCDLLLVSIHWGIEYAPSPRDEDVEIAHKMLEAGASAVIGHHPHVLQPVETYVTQDNRKTVIFFSLGNFLSNQSATYAEGLAPDKTAEPRDEIVGRFAVVKKDYGPGGTRVELADVGIMPVWNENNRLALRNGRAREPFIHPVFIDREISMLQAKIDALTKAGPQLSDDQKQEFVQDSSDLASLKHQREMILSRTGDDYVVPPPPTAQ